MADILNAFIEDRQAAHDENSITERTYAEYEAVCDTISAVWGSRWLPLVGVPVEQQLTQLFGIFD